MMTTGQMKDVMGHVFAECADLRDAGFKEYSGGESVFGNFERLAVDLQMDRKKILWVFARKYIDGIVSYLNGHRSQPEDVRGRINDLIVYMCLLRGMIDDENPAPSVSQYEADMHRGMQRQRPTIGEDLRDRL